MVRTPSLPGTSTNVMSVTGSLLPSPQSIVAVKSSAVPPAALSKPGSLKVAGGSVMKSPSLIDRLAIGVMLGATFETNTSKKLSNVPPLSSVTVSVTVYVPSSA